LIKKNKIPKYLKILIENHSKIASGRKNFEEHNNRVLKTLEIIKKYFDLKN
tara:strand:- start:48 stop:200 length:153 start_codon:yes stop_codon:yes gene_type:complete